MMVCLLKSASLQMQMLYFVFRRLPGHLQGSQHQQHRGGQDESAQEESDPPQQRQ